MNQSSVLHSTWRAVVALISFGAPVLFTAYPAWESLTVGTIVYGLLHYIQTKVGV